MHFFRILRENIVFPKPTMSFPSSQSCETHKWPETNLLCHSSYGNHCTVKRKALPACLLFGNKSIERLLKIWIHVYNLSYSTWIQFKDKDIRALRDIARVYPSFNTRQQTLQRAKVEDLSSSMKQYQRVPHRPFVHLLIYILATPILRNGNCKNSTASCVWII